MAAELKALVLQLLEEVAALKQLAVAEVGVQAFSPLLLDFIQARSAFDGNVLVGGTLDDIPASPGILHELKWRWQETAFGRFLLVGVRLFACFGGPQHFVVVGTPPAPQSL